MKKTYSAPTLTVHGNAVEQTQGTNGSLMELIGLRKKYP